MRIGNLEFRNTEIVCWNPNAYYGNIDKYELVKEGGLFSGKYYKDPNSKYGGIIHEDCFKNPEYCFTIASFHKDEDGYYELEFIGDRPLSGAVNWMDFRTLVQVGYNTLNKGNNETY